MQAFKALFTDNGTAQNTTMLNTEIS